MLKNQLAITDEAQLIFWILIDKDRLFCPNLGKICFDLDWNTEKFIKKAIVVGEYQSRPIAYLHLKQIDQNQLPFSGQWYTLKEQIDYIDNVQFELASKALTFSHFYDTHRFCGRCGNRMRPIHWEIASQCYKCQHRCYPRLSPCIIVAITWQDKILLAQGKRSKDGTFSVIAGFMEPGETVEQAVEREVIEEVGLKIKNIQYISSQPWPFPHNLMLGFTAEYESGEIVIDKHEIIDAKWFTIDALPKTPGSHSIARALIDLSIEKIESKK